jgi:hypothetical protein
MSTVVLSPKWLVRDYGSVRFHEHWCPGCEAMHQVAIDNPFRNGARWTWDGNASAPSLSPSVNVGPGTTRQCHYFLRSGVLEFLSDCHHGLRGQKVPLPDIPADWLD